MIVSAWLVGCGWKGDTWLFQVLLLGLGALFVCLFFLCLYLATLPLPEHDYIITFFCHILSATVSYLHGLSFLRLAIQSWKTPRASQEKFLLKHLKDNANTEYSKRFMLEKVKSCEDFRKGHPLITYEDYKPYIERTMEGAANVLSPKTMGSFVRTSGTTGPSKFFGHADRAGILRERWDVLYANLCNLCPKLRLSQKWLYLYATPVTTTAKNGGTIETALTLPPSWGLYNYATPKVGFSIASIEASNYIHLLFALRDPSIGIVFSPFILNIEHMMNQLEQSWESLVCDIEHGTINDTIILEDAILDSLIRQLQGGNKERAEELRRLFQQGFDDGIMKRIWPHLEVILGIDGGVWASLKRKYAKGISLVCGGYGSSETLTIAISPWIWDERPQMVFLNYAAFLEFIKLEDVDESQPRTYLIDEVEVGEEYEVVVTQASGLYRSRLGDIIRFVGYHHRSPCFEFLYRLGLTLNVRNEKMNQKVLKDALHAAVSCWSGTRLVEYAVAESTLIPQSHPAFVDKLIPYYLVFLELEFTSSQFTRHDITNEHLQLVDKELCDRNSLYKDLRDRGGISHPSVYVLKPGTFDDLKKLVLRDHRTSANQYKIRRKLRTLESLQLMFDSLDANIISSL
nr:uncharacterized protein LOC129275089 isoform X1 [Lytechinus pictus]